MVDDSEVCGRSSDGRGPSLIFGFQLDGDDSRLSRSGLPDWKDLLKSDLVGDFDRDSATLGRRGPRSCAAASEVTDRWLVECVGCGRGGGGEVESRGGGGDVESLGGDGDVKSRGPVGSRADADGSFTATNSSGTVDALFDFCLPLPSSSSAISISRRRCMELVEEDVDLVAVCSEQAAESVESLSSRDELMGKTVSWGEKCSTIALK